MDTSNFLERFRHEFGWIYSLIRLKGTRDWPKELETFFLEELTKAYNRGRAIERDHKQSYWTDITEINVHVCFSKTGRLQWIHGTHADCPKKKKHQTLDMG